MRYTIVDYFGYDLPPQARMKAIKQAGFDGVILLWADYFDADYRAFPDYAAHEGLYVENAHAPYRQANAIWEDTVAGEAYTEHILGCIRECRSCGIPTLVLHPANGAPSLPEHTVGIDRFKRIIEAAERHSVNIAAENQGSPEHLALVFREIQSDRLLFCFDSGHEHCYSPRIDFLQLYGDKLAALHLHDNDGKEDAHALPFTGSVDWCYIADHLTRLRYSGAVALETLNRGFEHIQDPVEFLRLALERAKRIL